ncbi:Transmembrane protein 183, partial [Stegodyphus mimosarum]
MPKGGKKGERKNVRDAVSDIKLSDFANCSARTGRLRKSAGSSIEEEVKDVCNEETLWFERDLEEFQFPETSHETRKKHVRSKTLSADIERRPGIRYPIDVWFLIGQFVKPEAVKVFASICKDSYFVSRTYSFWINMYKRHYQAGAHLPQRLQPECIEASFCLKMSVVRALYHMYPHFTNQLSTRMQSMDVHSLSNLCCTSMWRVQQNGKWLFHFKFQAPVSASSSPMSFGVVIQDLWTNKDNDDEKGQETYVNHNPDEGSKILRVSCSHFVAVPPFVMGSRLSDVRINLTQDMRRQKLQLTFCYANYSQINKSTNSKTGAYGDVVEFDPVESIVILNWWHPQYPTSFKV